jgi:hypothetical protein
VFLFQAFTFVQGLSQITGSVPGNTTLRMREAALRPETPVAARLAKVVSNSPLRRKVRSSASEPQLIAEDMCRRAFVALGRLRVPAKYRNQRYKRQDDQDFAAGTVDLLSTHRVTFFISSS